MHELPGILVYSAGGFGREVAWVAEAMYAGQPGFAIRFVDDGPKQGQTINGWPVIGYDEAKRDYRDFGMVNAIGNTATREKVVARTVKDGFRHPILRHPGVHISAHDNVMGDGCIICAGTVITCNTRLGRNVNLNLNCTVGHDTVIGDFVSAAPGANIAGCVEIGPRTYVGTGASIINGTQDRPLRIGADVTIGAGAVVVRDVADGQTVVGVPARPIG